MRGVIWSLAILTAFCVAAGSSGAGTRAVSSARAIPKPICTIASIKLLASRQAVAAVGSCKVRNRRIPVAWKHVYSSRDVETNTCGSPKIGSARTFVVRPPGAHRVRVTFTLTTPRSPMWTGARVSRTATLTLGGRGAHCARLRDAAIPPAAVMCHWQPTTPWPCGTLTAGTTAAWTSPITFKDGVVSAGRIATEVGECWLAPLLNFPSYDYLGFRQQPQRLLCADNEVYALLQWYLTMVNPRGEACGPWRPPFIDIFRFRIPSSWGGELRVMWQIEGGAGRDTTAATIKLPGNEDGCPLLMSAGRPWPYEP